MKIDKTFEENGLILKYKENSNEAVAFVKDFKKFIEEFPNIKYLFNEPVYTDFNKFFIKKIETNLKNNKNIEKYKKLEILDNFLELLSIKKSILGKGRSYQYEIYINEGKNNIYLLLVDGYIDYNYFKKISSEFLELIEITYSKLKTNQIEKEKILEILKEQFKNKKKINFNDITELEKNIIEKLKQFLNLYENNNHELNIHI